MRAMYYKQNCHPKIGNLKVVYRGLMVHYKISGQTDTLFHTPCGYNRWINSSTIDKAALLTIKVRLCPGKFVLKISVSDDKCHPSESLLSNMIAPIVKISLTSPRGTAAHSKTQLSVYSHQFIGRMVCVALTGARPINWRAISSTAHAHEDEYTIT